jgi:hypothetical protein
MLLFIAVLLFYYAMLLYIYSIVFINFKNVKALIKPLCTNPFLKA